MFILETKLYLAFPEGGFPGYFVRLGVRQAEGVCAGAVSHQGDSRTCWVLFGTTGHVLSPAAPLKRPSVKRPLGAVRSSHPYTRRPGYTKKGREN